MCPSTNTYTISCDYVCGCNLSGCSYNLISTTDIIITGNIEGSKVDMIESNKVSKKIFHLTVRDLSGATIESKSITFNDDICPTTTGQVFSNYPYIYICNTYLLQQQLLLQNVHQNLVVLASVVV